MSASNTTPEIPLVSTTGRVTFQSTTNSGVNSTRSSNEGPATPNHELSKKELIENNLTQLFTKGFLSVLTSKNAVLKEVRDCILQGGERRCKDMNPYLHSYWRDLHVHSCCPCVDERLKILKSLKDAMFESQHLTHPRSWGMITLGQYAFGHYMHREILNKAAK